MKTIIRILGSSMVAGLLVMALSVGSASASLCQPSSSDPWAAQARSIEACEQGQDSLTLNRSQPIPEFGKSQLRQELIDVEEWQATGATSTSFAFANNGKLLFSCPSIGAPLASDTQLTNPLQAVWEYSGDTGVATGNEDPTGVYTGASTGTYTMCVSSTAGTYAAYWEGSVMTVAGPATYSPKTGIVALSGQPNSLFTNVK